MPRGDFVVELMEGLCGGNPELALTAQGGMARRALGDGLFDVTFNLTGGNHGFGGRLFYYVDDLWNLAAW